MAFALRRVAIATLLCAAAPAAAETPPPYGGKIVAGLTSAPQSFDPVAAQSWTELTLAGLVFDTLYRWQDQEVVPHLAAGPPAFSDDGLEARVTLKAGVTFHDGRPLKPTDAAASLKRAMNAPLSEWALAPVAKITVDGYDLVFKLDRQTPELATLLATPQLAVTPGGKAPGALPIGSGPFAVKKIVDGDRRIELAAALDHWSGRAYVEAITLRWFVRPEDEARAYEAGDADISLRGAVAFAGHQPKYPSDAIEGPRTLLVYAGFCKAHPELAADRDFRRGVSLAINRAAFKHVGTEEKTAPAVLPESPDLGGKAPAAAEVDARPDDALVALRKAALRRPELEAALAQRGALGLVLIVDESRPDDAEVAARVVAGLDKVGLAVTFTSLPAKEYARRVAAGQCDLHIGQLLAPSGDPVHEYAAAFAAGGDKWPLKRLEEGRFTLDAAAHAFADRLPVVPLFHRAVRASHKQTLLGVAFDRIGRLAFADLFVFEGLPAETEIP